MLRIWLKKIVLFPLFLLMGVEGDGGAAGGDQGAAPAGDTVLGGGASAAGTDDAGAGGAAEGTDGLFTPEEIEAKRESIAAAKAEETRRAALTQEQRDAEDATKAAEEKAKAGAPETYEEFTLPEEAKGIELNKETVDALKPIAKELNLSQERAQLLFNKLLTEVHPKLEAERKAAWDNVTKGWADTAKADPEIGGANWDKTVEIAQRALNTFGTPELKSALNQFGMGNHPEMIRLMARMGNAMREDTIVLPGSQAGGSKKSVADRLYGGGEK